MMSATTVFSETPASTPATPAANSAAGGSVAIPTSSARSDFQNLLGGAVPAIEPVMVVAQPMQALAQLITTKNLQQGAKPGAVASPLVADASPNEMLRLLTDSATLLPEGAAPDALSIDDDSSEPIDADVLAEETAMSDWLNVMLPATTFAARAFTAGGDVSADPGQIPTPTSPGSLQAQIGLPLRQEAVDLPAQLANPGANNSVAAVSSAAGAAVPLNPVAAFQAAVNLKADTTDREQSSVDSWSPALGEFGSRRSQELAGAAASQRIGTPVHDARWADALANRLVMMAREGESVASLRLVPQDLGPLDIQITVRDDQATVHFGAAHQETRAALEASMPRLRELLQAQGLQLGNASVSHQSAGGQNSDRGTGNGGVAGVEETEAAATARAVSTALLDTYA